MKFFLVLALALFANLAFAQFTYPSENEPTDTETEEEVEQEWVTLKSREYRKGHIEDLLDDGADFVIDANIEDGALSNTDFDIETVSKAEKQTAENGTNYRFTVVINDGEVKAQAIYVVYDPEHGKEEVVSSSLHFIDRSKLGEDGAPAGQNAWSRVSLSKYNKSETMQEALYDGVEYIIDQGIAHEILPNASFEVSEPNYVASVKVRNGGTKYRFQVEIRNEFGSAKTVFVSYKGKVVSYFLDHNDIVIPEPEAPEAPEAPEEEEAPEAPEAPEEDEEEEDIEEEVEEESAQEEAAEEEEEAVEEDEEEVEEEENPWEYEGETWEP